MPPLSDELVSVVDEAAARLRRITEADASIREQADSWSAKEIVGHLIDSAVNNLHRFVRAQQADELVFPGYEQDHWVRVQGYQERPWLELIDLWVSSNHHLAHTIRRIPEASLAAPCRIGSGEPVTLRFLVEDYLSHLRHHLSQIEER